MLIFHWNWMELGVPYSFSQTHLGGQFFCDSANSEGIADITSKPANRERHGHGRSIDSADPQPIYDARALL